MGAAARWLKSLIGIKKPKRAHEGQDNLKISTTGKSKRWSVWKLAGSDRLREENRGKDDLFGAYQIQAVAKHEAVINYHEQWAAVRIQSGFRRFLARRAFRALRALVRIQAIVRGRQVRKQAAMALRCMKALIKVQALVRARRVRMSREGRSVQQRINQRRVLEAQLQRSEQRRWCDSLGTIEEIQTRFQHKLQAAINRERAMQYALYHQAFKPRTYQQQRQHPEENSPLEWWEDQALEQGFQHRLERELNSSKEIKVTLMPQITIAYSGPIFSSPQLQASAVPPSSAFHSNSSNSKQTSPQFGCKSERWTHSWAGNAERKVGSMKPGYTQATISEVHSNNSNNKQTSPQLGCKSERWTHSWAGNAESKVGSMKPGYMQATISEFHSNNSINKQTSPQLGCKSDRWSHGWAAKAERQVDDMKPGYMQATISVRAKSRSLSEPKLQLAFDEFHSERRCSRPPPCCLDTQKLLLQCN